MIHSPQNVIIHHWNPEERHGQEFFHRTKVITRSLEGHDFFHQDLVKYDFSKLQAPFA